MRQPSRLARTLEKQTKKQIVASLVGIILILFLLSKFGPTVLSSIGNMISVLKGGEQATTIRATSLLVPPTLNPLPTATSEPTITMFGSIQQKDGVVEIYINDTSYKNIRPENDGTFKLENVTLSEGENLIKARVKVDDKTSEFSKEVTIIYTKDAPKLEISSPSDGATFAKADQEITVGGKTEPDNAVTVNEFRAIVNNDGSFSYLLKLNEGENTITVVAENTAGKKTEKTVKVTYKP